MQQSANPLKTFFRQPAIYVRLPSDGDSWAAGSLDMPVNQELPVLPMTAMDEISYRTPDALFNGAAVVNTIHSCLPNITNAWKMPMIDFNTVLAAIRIASHGHELDVETECTNCHETSDFSMDMRSVLDQMTSPNFGETVAIGNLEIYFKPIIYEEQNAINIAQFEQQRVLIQLPDMDLDEVEKNRRLDEAIKNITLITIQAMQAGIKAIKTPQLLVTEPEHIREFLLNCDRNVHNKIRDHVIKLRVVSELAPLKINCPHCGHHYEQAFVLDTAHFFANAS